MMLVEVLLDDPKVTRVRAKEEVEGVADERHRAERGIDAEIADHAPDLPFRHTEVARFPDQIGAHRRRDHVADDGDEADDGVRPTGRLIDRKSTRLNSSHYCAPRMPSSA